MAQAWSVFPVVLSSCQHVVLVQVADVLKLVVENCPSASEIRTLCSLLQVSRAVQQELQKAAGHCRVIMPTPMLDDEGAWSTAELALCCSWLPKYAGLVRDVSFAVGNHTSTAVTAHHMIHTALKLGAGAARPWRLQSLAGQWNDMYPSILEPMAACTSLTALSLNVDLWASRHCATLYAAVGQLQWLQQLKLVNKAGNATLDSSFTAAISQLTGLQRLELGTFLAPTAVEGLPTSLTALTLMMGNEDDIGYIDAVIAKGVSLQHLVELQELGLQCKDIPGRLYRTLSHLIEVVDVAELQQLRRLRISDGMALVPVVAGLSSLQGLQVLNVGLPGCEHAEAGQVLRACLAGVAAATQLTQLGLVGDAVVDGPLTYRHGVQLHGYLKQLTQLRHLEIAHMDIEASDAIQFTALTSLTALHMSFIPTLQDTAAGALACRLPNLRVLHLSDCGVGIPVLWLVGMATGLESLHISSLPPLLLDVSALGFLTGLTRLTSLKGPVVTASPEAFRGFPAAMPALVVTPKVLHVH
jgi:hypothetical protein